MPDSHTVTGQGWDALRERLMHQNPRTAAGLRPECPMKDVSELDGESDVIYWSDEDRRANETIVIDGRLHQGADLVGENNSKALSSRHWFSEKLRFGYVLAHAGDGERSLYIFDPEQTGMKHSSPLAGSPVLDAGMMTISNGQVAYIEHRSGHYMPNPEQVHHTIDFLASQGVSLSGVYFSEHIATPWDLPDIVQDGAVTLHDISILHGTASLEKSQLHIEYGTALEDVTRLPACREGATRDTGRASPPLVARPDRGPPTDVTIER